MAASVGNSDKDKTLEQLEAAYDTIEKIDAATKKANASLNNYTKAYKSLNKELKEFTKLNGKNGKLNIGAGKTGGKVTSGLGGIGKIDSKTAKAFQSTASKMVSGTALKALGPIMAATSGVAALGLVIKTLGSAASDAEQRLVNYTKALRTMGVALDANSASALEYANNSNKLSNQLSQVWNDIGSGFSKIGEWFTSGMSSILEDLGYSGSETKDVIAGAQASTVAKARGLGFTNASSRGLAGNLYNLSSSLSPLWGDQPSEIMTALESAVFTGKGAEKYGFNVSDNVLTGYLAKQGIDIANVEITDAMKAYYRYQLLSEESLDNNSEAMSEFISQWEQLGFMIDKTKGKLFGFDEVIQLTAADSTIPEIAGSLVGGPDDGEGGGTIIPPIPPGPTGGGGNGTTEPSKQPYPENIKIPVLDEIFAWLKIRFPMPVPGKQEEGEGELQPELSPEGVPATDPIADWLYAKYGIRPGESALEAYQGLMGIPGVPEEKEYGWAYDSATRSHKLIDVTGSTNYIGQRMKLTAEEAAQYGYVEPVSQAASSASGQYTMYPQGTQFGTASSLSQSTVDFLEGMESVGQALMGLGSLGIVGLLGALVAPQVLGAGAALGTAGAATSGLTAAFGFAGGGIGTKQINGASLFEGDKAEAVIPLESQAGIDFLGNAMKQAMGGEERFGGDQIIVNLNLSGLNVADDDSRWEQIGTKIAEVIDVQRQRRGELNYGAAY